MSKSLHGALLLPRPPSSARIASFHSSSGGASYASASEGSLNEDEAERRMMSDCIRIIRGLPKRRSSEMLRSEHSSPSTAVNTHMRGATGRLLETIQALSSSHIGDVSDDAPSQEHSGESPCSPTTPPLSNLGTPNLHQQQAHTGFRFTNLPASLRTLTNPIAMARSLLPALRSVTATHSSSSSSNSNSNTDALATWEAKFEATLGSHAIDKATSEQLLAFAGLQFDGAVGAHSTAAAPLSSMYTHDVPYPADLRAERYSDADGSSSYSAGEDLNDGNEAEAWSSQAGNKKKRKSTRAAGNEDRGHAGTGATSDYPHLTHHSSSAGGTHLQGVDRQETRGAYETDYADLPFVRRKTRVPLSLRALVERRLIVVARARAFRMTKYRERLAAQQAATAPEPEKKQPKRLSKAEKRAHAMRAGSGAKPQTTLAALRAKVAAAGANKGERKSPEQPVAEAAPAPLRTPSPPPRKPIVVPTSEFRFTLPSPIATHLTAMRNEFEALQARLSDSMRPVDDTVASATDAFSRLDTREADVLPSSSSTGHLVKSREAIKMTPTSSSSLAPASSSPPSFKSAPASAAAGTVMPLSIPPPPPLLNQSKMSRRKKANMGNVHHRSNYVPSRMPSDRSARPEGSASAATHVVSADAAPGMDHPTTTSALFSEEWMCVFCEYRMLYGEYPRMLRACKARKKLVSQRSKAQARAHRVAEGGSLVDVSLDKRKKKHMRPRCTCGDHSEPEGDALQHPYPLQHQDVGFATLDSPLPLNHNIDDID